MSPNLRGLLVYCGVAVPIMLLGGWTGLDPMLVGLIAGTYGAVAEQFANDWSKR